MTGITWLPAGPCGAPQLLCALVRRPVPVSISSVGSFAASFRKSQQDVAHGSICHGTLDTRVQAYCSRLAAKAACGFGARLFSSALKLTRTVVACVRIAAHHESFAYSWLDASAAMCPACARVSLGIQSCTTTALAKLASRGVRVRVSTRATELRGAAAVHEPMQTTRVQSLSSECDTPARSSRGGLTVGRAQSSFELFAVGHMGHHNQGGNTAKQHCVESGLREPCSGADLSQLSAMRMRCSELSRQTLKVPCTAAERLSDAGSVSGTVATRAMSRCAGRHTGTLHMAATPGRARQRATQARELPRNEGCGLFLCYDRAAPCRGWHALCAANHSCYRSGRA